MTINLIIMLFMVAAALWAVLARTLLKGSIALAIASAALALLIFRMNGPLAAVFELSVCAGLITVIFISTISLVQPFTPQEVAARYAARFKRFWPLLVLLAVVTVICLKCWTFPACGQALPESADVMALTRDLLWKARQMDLFGQVVMLLAGVFGVVILFKEENPS
ncbi:MAG: hypothetical protein PHV34_00745 [Verrucomicrobiae bacterium]|nr:hypothetical protein [Verrucomicrobiae bacterium]